MYLNLILSLHIICDPSQLYSSPHSSSVLQIEELSHLGLSSNELLEECNTSKSYYRKVEFAPQHSRTTK